MKLTSRFNIKTFLSIITSLCFGLIILSFYIYTHPEYEKLIEGPPQFKIFMVLILVYVFPFLFQKLIQSKIQNFNLPVFIPITLTFIAGLYITQYYFLNEIGYWENADMGHYTIQLITALGGLAGLLLLSWLTGILIEMPFRKKQTIDSKQIILQIGKGIMAITFLLFLLGLLEVLNQASLLIYSGIVFLLSIFFNRKIEVRPLLKWPVSSNYSILDHFLIFGVILILLSNFLEQLRPIPTGYDGMTVYANISFLLDDYGKLVEGFGAYNWSLFASSGLILFQQAEMVLLANFLIVLLSFIALYILFKPIIGKTAALTGVLIIGALPSFNRMVYMQQKVEGAVLFFSVIILIQILKFIKEQDNNWLILQIGITAGFLFGIKYSNVMFVIPLVIGIWYIQTGFWGLIASTSAALVVLLNAKLDTFSGLIMLHNPSNIYLYFLGMASVISFGILLFRNKNPLQQAFKSSLIIFISLILTFAPWAYKNSKEIDKISLMGIIQGRSETYLIK